MLSSDDEKSELLTAPRRVSLLRVPRSAGRGDHPRAHPLPVGAGDIPRVPLLPPRPRTKPLGASPGFSEMRGRARARRRQLQTKKGVRAN